MGAPDVWAFRRYSGARVTWILSVDIAEVLVLALFLLLLGERRASPNSRLIAVGYANVGRAHEPRRRAEGTLVLRRTTACPWNAHREADVYLTT